MDFLSITGTEDPITLARKLNANFALVRSLSIASSSTTLTPFSATIPLNGLFVMSGRVTSGLNFTPAAGAQAGAACTLTLYADGVNTPSFGGFTQDPAGGGWNNTAGAVNIVNFRFDGSAYWYRLN